ncbi:hypothetical protein R3P38DRAFT_3229643 [Favolaschia claudopus]|uniref:Uncharacterized protein n=1 Tax=Favolaschia claudopus TaxID=2862362 RepID=A0AAV9ZNU6_9AGAR
MPAQLKFSPSAKRSAATSHELERNTYDDLGLWCAAVVRSTSPHANWPNFIRKKHLKFIESDWRRSSWTPSPVSGCLLPLPRRPCWLDGWIRYILHTPSSHTHSHTRLVSWYMDTAIFLRAGAFAYARTSHFKSPSPSFFVSHSSDPRHAPATSYPFSAYSSGLPSSVLHRTLPQRRQNRPYMRRAFPPHLGTCRGAVDLTGDQGGEWRVEEEQVKETSLRFFVPPDSCIYSNATLVKPRKFSPQVVPVEVQWEVGMRVPGSRMDVMWVESLPQSHMTTYTASKRTLLHVPSTSAPVALSRSPTCLLISSSPPFSPPHLPHCLPHNQPPLNARNALPPPPLASALEIQESKRRGFASDS